MSDVNEKLQDLQESMQKLQILKALGTERLILEQEKEIYQIQQDIMKLNNDVSVDIIDAILPKKCKFCTEKTTEEERLECFEKNGDTCKNKEPKNVNMFNGSFLKLIILYLSIVTLLITFLLLTNIFSNYFENKILLFGIASIILIIIIFLVKKPVKQIYSSS